jgi:arylsulfatase A-like enzyme
MSDSPNILFLVVDSLRYDTISGSWEADTPNIDDLSKQGVTFSQCFSHGISTAPAMAAMLTGRLPLDYGGHWYLDADQPTFAEVFQRHGYETGAIHSNPYVSSRRNFDRGFDTFQEDIVTFEPDETLEYTPEKLRRIANRVARILSRTPYTPAEEVNENMLGFLDNASEPWFLWTQYMDVHGPYLGGDDFSYRNKFRTEWLWRKAAVRDPDAITDEEHAELRRKYCLEVEYLDQAIGELLDELETRGVLEDTLVILTADHGDEFYEHGRYGHGNLPYAELTHVPFIMRFPPDRGIDTTTVDDLVRSVDILPTALSAVNAELGTSMEQRCVGRSLLPALHGESVSADYVVTEKRVRDEENLRIGIRDEEWTFLYDGKDNAKYLYDLTSDPDEQDNIIDDQPQIRNQFERILEQRFDSIQKTSEGVKTPKFTEDTGVEERLRALGYRE